MKRPAIAEKTEIRYSEVILLGESKLQNSGPDKDQTYQSVCNLQIYSSHPCSPDRDSRAQTPQSTRKSEKTYIKTSTRAETTSKTEDTSCPSIYSEVLFSQTLKCLPVSLQPHSYPQFTDCQQSTLSVSDVKLQLDGDGEASVPLQGTSATRADLSLSQTEELETFRPSLRQHQSPVSFSDLSSISYSSVRLSHPAEVTSPQHPFCQSLYNSAPSFQPDAFTHPDALSDTLTTLPSLFPHSLFVDFSYCPAECDPYVSALV